MEKDKKWGLYNVNGEVISQPRFDGFQTFADGLAWVKNGEKWGFINEAGVMLISATYDWAQPFSDGLAVVSKDGLNG
ncbi:MAG: WG repeat-containing protein [Chitinophagaceae bacterium]|nr:WG repeat-containing protein [Chitinophagaceae bacterium]